MLKYFAVEHVIRNLLAQRAAVCCERGQAARIIPPAA